MGCANGSSRATSRSNMLWAGPSIWFEVIKPCDDTGNWSVAHSRFVGITPPTAPLREARNHGKGLIWKVLLRRRFQLMKQERGKKIREEKGVRPQISWPMALRAVRAW